MSYFYIASFLLIIAGLIASVIVFCFVLILAVWAKFFVIPSDAPLMPVMHCVKNLFRAKK